MYYKNVKSVTYKKVSPYQNIRIINQQIEFDRAVNRDTSFLVRAKKENQYYKKQNIELKKKLKQYKASKKSGVNNKGWITRVERKIKRNDEFARESNRDLSELSPPSVKRENGRLVREHKFVKEHYSVDDLQKFATIKDIEHILGPEGYARLDGRSPTLEIAINKMMVSRFGTVDEYFKFKRRHGV